MDIINFSNSRFYPQNIIPEVNDELTVQWGRMMVNNLINAYGIIGRTAVLGNEQSFVQIPIGKIFNKPPSITIMYKIFSPTDNNWTLNPSGPPYEVTIWWSFTVDGVFFKKNPMRTLPDYEIIYRINGV